MNQWTKLSNEIYDKERATHQGLKKEYQQAKQQIEAALVEVLKTAPDVKVVRFFISQVSDGVIFGGWEAKLWAQFEESYDLRSYRFYRSFEEIFEGARCLLPKLYPSDTVITVYPDGKTEKKDSW